MMGRFWVLPRSLSMYHDPIGILPLVGSGIWGRT